MSSDSNHLALNPYRYTPKEEGFSQAIAVGIATTEAYRRFYTCNGSTNRVYVDACRLAQKPKIILRVKEIQALATRETAFTVEVSRTKLIEVYTAALTAKHYGAAVSALVEANKISGFHVQKVEVNSTVTHKDERVSEFTTQELRDWVLAHRDHPQLQEPATEAAYHEIEA